MTLDDLSTETAPEPAWDVWEFIARHKLAENAHNAGFAADLHDELVQVRAERDELRTIVNAWADANWALTRARSLTSEWENR